MINGDELQPQTALAAVFLLRPGRPAGKSISLNKIGNGAWANFGARLQVPGIGLKGE
jgi:hypothetical protein